MSWKFVNSGVYEWMFVSSFIPSCGCLLDGFGENLQCWADPDLRLFVLFGGEGVGCCFVLFCFSVFISSIASVFTNFTFMSNLLCNFSIRENLKQSK